MVIGMIREMEVTDAQLMFGMKTVRARGARMLLMNTPLIRLNIACRGKQAGPRTNWRPDILLLMAGCELINANHQIL